MTRELALFIYNILHILLADLFVVVRACRSCLQHARVNVLQSRTYLLENYGPFCCKQSVLIITGKAADFVVVFASGFKPLIIPRNKTELSPNHNTATVYQSRGFTTRLTRLPFYVLMVCNERLLFTLIIQPTHQSRIRPLLPVYALQQSMIRFRKG